MALTEEQREIALRVGRDIAQTMQLNEPEGFLEFATRLLAALPKPDPVGNLNNGKFFWNTKGGPDKWRDRQNYDGPLYAEAPITQPASDYDLSGVIHLTHNKTKSIVDRGYKITGFVLTDETGRKCISDMSAVRWFDERVNFFRMMHPDNNPLPASAPSEQKAETFQSRVEPWLLACFGEEISNDKEERNHRFLEESLELVQATGCTASEAHQLVDYVFGRPVGEPHQEVGGVMVTLAALCRAQALDMHANGEIELARIWTKVEKIRAKQAAKPKHSPLPEATAPQPDYKVQRDAERYHFLRDSQEGKTIRIKPRLLWNEEIDAAIASVKGGA